ncbi:ATP-binding protein [Paenalcaligenes sp. Me131]|uniref:PAS domain-containing sensor histidine kinase n=1 Tax=Paenalcaligenes sp. Me131 TaxID=3392636 RepID=UPI003D2B4A36
MSYAPILAIAIIVILITLFILLLRKDRVDELRTKLIEDALWVEQNLFFQLRTHEENIERLAQEISKGQDPNVLLTRLQHVKDIHPELQVISWFDQQREAPLTLPRGYNPLPATAPLPRFKAWFPARQDEQLNEVLVDFQVPIFGANNQPTGLLRTSLSLNQLLTSQIPWWVAGQYEIVLVDNNSDRVIARRVNAALKTSELSHSMSVDPPLHGVRLQLKPYTSGSTSTQTLLIIVIVGLAIFAIISLLVQYYYARKRQQAEHALLDEQAFRRAMENSMTTGMRARDLEGRILYVNPAFCRLVGWEANEIIGLAPPMPWWPPDMVNETLDRHYQQNRMPTAQSFETRFQHRDGSILDIQVHEAPLINNQGKHMGWMGSIIDISSRKAQEERTSQQAEQLQKTAHLMSMGEVASTLAHELNQPLSAVASYAAGCLNLLEDTDSSPDDLRSGLKNLAAQNKRAGEIVRRTNDFVRKREPLVQSEKLRPIVLDSLGFIHNEMLKHKVRVTLDIPEAELYVMADRIMIEQVLFNLLRNALEALKNQPLDQRKIEINVQTRGQHALLAISDQGPGVAPEMMPLLFQPFSTNKVNGMGIGLNICRSIIELHRGTLWYESSASHGATFVFTLPLAKHD